MDDFITLGDRKRGRESMKIKRIKDQYVRQIQVVLIIYLVCCILRVVEYMILRTDQTFWGESFVHKLLGLVILVPTLRFYGLNSKQIGFGTKGLFSYASLGLVWGSLFFALAYLMEITLLLIQGNLLGLDFYVSAYSVSGNIGQQRGFLFLLICLAGNLINVLMEEGIFRGLFQKVFERKYSFLKAALLSNLLFGFWHIMGPFRSFLDGEMSLTGFWINSLILILTSFLIGFQFALMTKMTGSLYMGMAVHFVNNTVVNLLHVLSKGGVDQLLSLRITVAQTLSFLVLLIYYQIRKRSRH